MTEHVFSFLEFRVSNSVRNFLSIEMHGTKTKTATYAGRVVAAMKL